MTDNAYPWSPVPNKDQMILDGELFDQWLDWLDDDRVDLLRSDLKDLQRTYHAMRTPSWGTKPEGCISVTSENCAHEWKKVPNILAEVCVLCAAERRLPSNWGGRD